MKTFFWLDRMTWTCSWLSDEKTNSQNHNILDIYDTDFTWQTILLYTSLYTRINTCLHTYTNVHVYHLQANCGKDVIMSLIYLVKYRLRTITLSCTQRLARTGASALPPSWIVRWSWVQLADRFISSLNTSSFTLYKQTDWSQFLLAAVLTLPKLVHYSHDGREPLSSIEHELLHQKVTESLESWSGPYSRCMYGIWHHWWWLKL